MALSLVLLKIILAGVMLLLTIVFGLLPMKILKILRKRAAANADFENNRWPSLILCLLSCFTGGVFLATCFLHLLPEVNEHLQKLKTTMEWDIDYPIAELISCVGFFLVFFVEEIVVALLHIDHGHAHGRAGGHTEQKHTASHGDARESGQTQYLSATVNETKEESVLAADGEASVRVTVPEETEQGGEDNPCVHSALLTEDTPPKRPANGELASGAGESSAANGLGGDYLKSSTPAPPGGRNSHGSPPCVRDLLSGNRATSPLSEIYTSIDVAEPERCELPRTSQDEDPPILMVSRPHAHSHGVRSITLVLALSFHSIIEGLAFGVQSSSGDVTSLFVSLIVHKCIVAFSVGLQLARTHAHALRWVFACVVILALMSPVGCGIGMGIEDSNLMDEQAKGLTVMVFEGLAVGTFLYVTFFEVFIHERDNEHPNMLKLLVTVVGFAIMGGLRAMEHEHGDGDSHDTTTAATTTLAAAILNRTLA